MNGERTASEQTMSQAMASMVFGSLAFAIFGLQPLLYGAYVAEGGIAEARIGALAAAEIAAVALGSAGAIVLLRSLPARILGMLGIALLIAGNLLASGHQGGVALFVLRFVAGGGAGMMSGIAAAAIARSHRVGAWQGGFLLGQAIAQYLAMEWFTLYDPVASSFKIQLALALLGVLSLAALPFVPAHFKLSPERAEGFSHVPGARGFVMLFAILLSMGAAITIWAYAGVWLQDRGVPAEGTSAILSIGLAGQAVGALLATMWGEGPQVWKRALALKVLLLAALAVWIATPASALVAFTYGLFWIAATPALTSVLNAVDPQRRAVPYATTAQLTGCAIIPTVVGETLAARSLDLVVIVSGGILAASLILAMTQVPVMIRSGGGRAKGSLPGTAKATS